MLKKYIYLVSLFAFFLSAPQLSVAQNSAALWTGNDQHETFSKRTWYPDQYKIFSLEVDAMKRFLSLAPKEANVSSHASTFMIELPMPDGNFHRYTLVESPVVSGELVSQYPFIKTYAGQGIDDPTATIRCDMTQFGFHGYVLSANGTVYIDPVEFKNTEAYIVYYKHDIPGRLYPTVCLFKTDQEKSELNSQHDRIYQATSAMAIGSQLRTYRLALAANYEYTQFHGGTIAGALGAMVTTMNRVNGIYEREVGIRLIMVPNDTLLIYTASNDPYSNSSGSAMLFQNQTNCDNIIMSANYDIGHVFSTDGGGMAYLGGVCAGSHKAKGVTGSPAPIGDAFDVDFVAHEMAHQFGADHSFNTTSTGCAGNWTPLSAYEPGSGSTIMSYAGLCSPNDLQNNSDAYFHTKSFDDIVAYSQTGAGNTCAAITATGNNPPILTVPSATFTIPYQTPFKLTASATDPENDAVTFCWEEFDLGPSGNWNSPSGNAPIFRSFNPTTSPTRLFPKLSDILANITTIGEIKPGYNRSVSFRCTARDNRSGGGGVTHNPTSISLTVDSTGIPFAITYPNATGTVWTAGDHDTIRWDVGFTDVAPINTPNVNIYLSLDNGQSFPILLGASVPNSGSFPFTVPALQTSLGRIMVEADGNVFFDINNRPVTINDPMQVTEVNVNEYINLYPNPSGELVHCSMNTFSSGKCRIAVCDVTGRTVKEITFEKNRSGMDLTIDLSDISRGLYIVRFELPEGIAQKKLVKE